MKFFPVVYEIARQVSGDSLVNLTNVGNDGLNAARLERIVCPHPHAACQ